MTKHRTLSIKKLINTVPWDLFVRYFEQLAPDSRPGEWAFLNASMMEEFLNNPENDAAPAIREDFHRMNDVCTRGASLLFRAYEEYGIECDPDANPLELSMRLFLDHRMEFEYAWTLYLYFGERSSTCEFYFPAGDLNPSDDHRSLFQASMQGWFHRHKEGQECEVTVFRDHDTLLVRISRGSVIRTVARWNENRIAFEAFRPVREDLIIYEPARSCLSIKTRLRRDRERYLYMFAEHFAGDVDLARQALETKIFSLEPFIDNSFDYRGDGVIGSVALAEIHVKLGSVNEPTVIIRSTDVRPSLDSEIGGVPIRAGEWIKVALRFSLRLESRKKPQEVMVRIEPPGYSDLKQKTYVDIIEAYLRKEKVKRI